VAGVKETAGQPGAQAQGGATQQAGPTAQAIKENKAPAGEGYPTPAVAGNIQWYNRPIVDTSSLKSGTTRTVYSSSREENGMEVLFPVIYDGKLHSEDEAWQHYKQTGQHMGKFKSIADADAYAQKYHEDAEAGKYGKFPNGKASGKMQAPPSKPTAGVKTSATGKMTAPPAQAAPAGKGKMTLTDRQRFDKMDTKHQAGWTKAYKEYTDKLTKANAITDENARAAARKDAQDQYDAKGREIEADFHKGEKKSDQPPAGATMVYKDAQGNVKGYAVNGQYVPVGS
jgi:hypothetical protein